MPGSFEQLDNNVLRFADSSGAVYMLGVWEPHIIRVRYLPNAKPTLTRTWSIVDSQGICPLEGWGRDALPHPERADFRLTQNGDNITLDTGVLRLSITLDPFRIAWFDSGGLPLASDNKLLGYGHDDGIYHMLDRFPDEHYYGFGEKAGPLDKRSRRMRMRNTDALGYDAELSDPLYKHIPFYITLRNTRAFGLFYDTPYFCTFDMGAEIDNYYGDYRTFRAEGGDLDYYFIYGPSIEDVVRLYTMLTGRIPLPPRWSLGYLGSTMNYTDSPHAQQDLAGFVRLCQQHDIPCDGFHLSSGYSMGADGKRYVFTWNRDRIPNPHQMTQTFHDAGMQVIANIKPAMLTTHPRYVEAEASGLFIKDAHDDKPDLLPFWGGYGAHLDFTNPATIQWWKANVKAQLLDYGIDSTWNDNNEFHIRHGDARCHGFGQTTPIAALRPIQTMLMVCASHAAQTEHAPDRRPWLLTRAGAPGMQRYAATWTGDNRTSWHTLRYNIPMGLGMSLSGWANFGHDVGGFVGDAPDPELFVRWVQDGIFHPRFCIHSWRMEGGPVNAPWMYPEVLPLVRDALKFRQRLLPYLYSLLWDSSRTGRPVVRPMVYHFQDDPRCHTESFDFMLGPSLLVPSVLESGATTRAVYLPQGSAWYDWYTGTHYTGGQTITLDAPLDRFPLLARAGAIIPMISEDGQTYRVYAFPQRTNEPTEFTLYDDDGISLAYQRGDYTLTLLKMTVTEDQVILSSEGSTKPLEWIVPPGETREVILR
ncbi:MAG: DUF4968 domain-containing protein [Anaerolineae bacterium]|nr:DUF4968 domain-containing protein [Anaerolineae bacterium]